MKRKLSYLFIRRMAIKPGCCGNHEVMLFEWQKMPEGYRWF